MFTTYLISLVLYVLSLLLCKYCFRIEVKLSLLFYSLFFNKNQNILEFFFFFDIVINNFLQEFRLNK